MIFAARCQHTGSSHAGANAGADCCSGAAAKNCPQHGANAGGHSYFAGVAFGGTLALDSALRVYFADALAAAVRNHFNDLSS